MKKKMSTSVAIENLASEEEFEESGFCDAPIGNIVAQFKFDNDSVSLEESAEIKEPPAAKDPKETFESASNSFDFRLNSSQDFYNTRNLKSTANGKTPPVDGESFDINRTFTLRRSTVRHLHELKSAHPDVNAYLNTIVDTALNHYYDYIFNKNGSQV